jgi:hypothetical protein
LTAGVRLNRYEWTIIEREIHFKQQFISRAFGSAVNSSLILELNRSIDKLPLAIIVERISHQTSIMWNRLHTLITNRWLTDRFNWTRLWLHTRIVWLQQVWHQFVQSVQQYNGNVFNVLRDWLQNLRRTYLLQLKQWLDRQVLQLLHWCSYTLQQAQQWLMTYSLPVVQDHLIKVALRLQNEVKEQQNEVVNNRFDYTQKILSMVSAFFPPTAWFESPNELTWRPDRGEFTFVIHTNST